MRKPAFMIVVLALTFLAGCGGDTAEDVSKDMVANMKEMGTILTGITDEASAKAAVSKIEAVRVNGHPTQRLPGTLNVSFPAAEGESLILSLDLKGIAVSSGSACTSGSIEPSHVLMALGLDPQTALSSLRFSFGRDNTMDDVDYVMEHLPGIVLRLRGISALSAKG